jgi:ABC-type sugar transport system ATPase subunit/glycosidase
MKFLKLENLEKKYSKNGPMIVKKINLEIDKGEFVVFLGPSGCGKTTIMRMIAGLEEVTGGDILLEGKSIVNLLPKERGVSMIFQSYAVWPHMTVYDNIAYPLKLKKLSKEEIEKIVLDVSESCELIPYLKRYPSQLSGGQRQRVAVARAMAVKPKLFLMDEPLSSLDAKLRVSMRTELKKIHEKIQSTSIFVTHDQSEAMSLADKIVILNNGKIEQIGTPSEVYHQSKTIFVASFVGSPPTNFFDVKIEEVEGKLCAMSNGFMMPLSAKHAVLLERYLGRTVKLGIRPENIKVHLEATANTLVQTRIEFVEPQGSYIILILNIGGKETKVVTSDFKDIKSGSEVFLEFEEDALGFFDIETEKRIEEDQVYAYLKELYPGNYLETYQGINELIRKYRQEEAIGQTSLTEKDNILITYGDTLLKDSEKPLRTFKKFAEKYLKDKITTVHFLPIYPYTSDDGFSVVDYRKVREELGDWDDVTSIKEDGFSLMLDAVINHVSKSSKYMQGYLNGEKEYEDFFIEADPAADYSAVTRPRALPLLHEFQHRDGSKHLWTTFSEDQVDLNFKNPRVLLEMMDVLLFYAARGARFLRLDAVGLLWKEVGTKCMHLDQTHKIIKIIRKVLDSCFDVKLITETNVPHEDNIAYFGNGHDEASMVYQFPLPPLVMYSLLSQNTSHLTAWAKTLEKKTETNTFLNFLSSHDGIGVRPVEKILNQKEMQVLLDHTQKQGGKISYRNMPDGSIAPYELNINYLDAVTQPDDDADLKTRKFLAAHSVLLSLAGVPGIYIHSLLGSRSDIKGMEASNINRRINREKLNVVEVAAELNDADSLRSKVFNGFLSLLEKRAEHSAFNPFSLQEVLDYGSKVFALRRKSADEEIIYAVNLSDEDIEIPVKGGIDLINDQKITTTTYTLKPYQFIWLKL